VGSFFCGRVGCVVVVAWGGVLSFLHGMGLCFCFCAGFFVLMLCRIGCHWCDVICCCCCHHCCLGYVIVAQGGVLLCCCIGLVVVVWCGIMLLLSLLHRLVFLKCRIGCHCCHCVGWCLVAWDGSLSLCTLCRGWVMVVIAVVCVFLSFLVPGRVPSICCMGWVSLFVAWGGVVLLLLLLCMWGHVAVFVVVVVLL